MIIPDEQDLLCYRGQTWDQNIYLMDADDNVIDLTGATVKAQVRPQKNTEILTAEMTCTVTAAEGKITLGIDAATTAEIQNGIYEYDVKVTQNNVVTYYVFGKFIVKGRVTK